jgi:hypothetical protein
MEQRCATQVTTLRSDCPRIESGRSGHRTTTALRSLAALVVWLGAACGSSPATTPTKADPTLGLGVQNQGVPSAGSGSSIVPVTPATVTATAGSGAPPISVQSTGGAPSAPAPAAADILPCNVSTALATNCQKCHAATPIGGAPMPLVTFADLHKAAVTKPTMKVYQLVQTRIHDQMKPMPPIGTLPAVDMTALDTWIQAGALTGPSTDATCMNAPPTANPNKDGGSGPIVPGPGVTCYEFKTHQSTTMVDDVPYDVGPPGEHYEQFYFKVPWPKDTVATSYATISDNAAVLHHWLLFSTNETNPEGFHKTAPLPTLVGTNPVLLAGWAVGGPHLVAPDQVGFELPDPGGTINVQWHFYNSTMTDQKDASKVQICTVPKAMVQHIGGVTWLGTENLGGNKWTLGAGMPAHMMSTFTTTCTPGRGGLAATDSIHIIGFEPHMHRLGKQMSTTIVHMDGTMEKIFDEPFSFGSETHYFKDVEVKPGEKLTTSCTFNNTTDKGVPFGESSDTEMCYQFTFAWPAHSIRNGAASLLGVTDTCW